MGRIDHELQRELARLISTELKDPRLGFVTVTRVEITSDLRTATIYVSIIGDRHVAKQSMLALESARGYLRGELGHAVQLRHTPELVFIEDRSTEKAIALSKVLARTAAASAAEAAAAASGLETAAESGSETAAESGLEAKVGGTDDRE